MDGGPRRPTTYGRRTRAARPSSDRRPGGGSTVPPRPDRFAERWPRRDSRRLPSHTRVLRGERLHPRPRFPRVLEVGHTSSDDPSAQRRCRAIRQGSTGLRSANSTSCGKAHSLPLAVLDGAVSCASHLFPGPFPTVYAGHSIDHRESGGTADAPDLGSGARKGMGVRLPPLAPSDEAVSAAPLTTSVLRLGLLPLCCHSAHELHAVGLADAHERLQDSRCPPADGSAATG